MGLNEYTSETLRRSDLHLAANLLGEEGRALTKDHGAVADSLDKVAAVSQLLKAGQWSDVLDACAALPPAVQNDRSVMLIRLQAAENYSITSRAEVLEDWLKAYPDEMDLPLKLADHFLTQERWDDAERGVTFLLECTGGDTRLQLRNIKYRRDRDKLLRQTAAARN
jgi:thioredoxin-like negative regulator of GroEL